MKKWTAATRDTLFRLVGDRDQWVRERALKALKKCEVEEADAQVVEEMLTRKGSELRQGVITLLARQKTPLALASADRLLAAKKAEQKLGGLELLRLLVEKKRSVEECRQRAEAYRSANPAMGEFELLNVEAVLDVKREVPTLDNALGLLDPTKRTTAPLPRARKPILCSAAALACLKSLDALIAQHKETPVVIQTYRGEAEVLLGNVNVWEFPNPNPLHPAEADASARLPLYQVWKDWYDNRPKKLYDPDGLELLRASVWWPFDPRGWKSFQKQHGKHFGDFLTLMLNGETPVSLKHPHLTAEILQWLLRLHPPAVAADFLLDALETGYAMVPEDVRKRIVNLDNWQKRDRDWRACSPIDPWQSEIDSYRKLVPEAWTEPHLTRLWQLYHWRDQPAPGVARMRPALEYLIAGCKAGLTSEADLYDQLLAAPLDNTALRTLTVRSAPQLLECPALVPIVERCKERILEIEFKRGETPTAASQPAQAISSLTGAPMLLRLVQALGPKAPARQTYGFGRTEVFTHLIQATYPAGADTLEGFAAHIEQAGLTRERLLDLAFLAPQWLDHIEHTIDWPGLKEGVWWFLAHMPSGRPGAEAGTEEDEPGEAKGKAEEQGDLWERILRERTALTEEDRRDGAVDTRWFHRVYQGLGRKRWELLSAAAKYGCSDNSHKKAILLAEVLLGRAKKRDLVANVRDRKLKDSVRYLGLLPLPEGERREAEVLCATRCCRSTAAMPAAWGRCRARGPSALPSLVWRTWRGRRAIPIRFGWSGPWRRVRSPTLPPGRSASRTTGSRSRCPSMRRPSRN